VDRYSFTVVDFHHLLLAGLPGAQLIDFTSLPPAIRLAIQDGQTMIDWMTSEIPQPRPRHPLGHRRKLEPIVRKRQTLRSAGFGLSGVRFMTTFSARVWGTSKCHEPQSTHQSISARLANRSSPAIAMAAAMEVAAARTWVSAMNTFFHIFLPLPQDRTIGDLIEAWGNAAMELLIAIGLILFVVGAPLLLVAGMIYSTP
jgi:hypothetical protein